MLRTILVVLCIAVCTAEMSFDYDNRATKVGEFTPPAPPAKEVKHLAHIAGRNIPAPTDEKLLAAIEISTKVSAFIETSEGSGAGAGSGSGEGSGSGTGESAKVPHNWFGTGKFVSPAYSVATGKEECDVCKSMIAAKRKVGTVGSSKPAKGNEFGCGAIGSKFEAMCLGYTQYLSECPSFVHDICHEDVGGSESLRAPCPDHLTCYYCLRINPLYCID